MNRKLDDDLDAALTRLEDRGGVVVDVDGEKYEIRIDLFPNHVGEEAAYLSLDDVRLLLRMSGVAW